MSTLSEYFCQEAKKTTQCEEAQREEETKWFGGDLAEEDLPFWGPRLALGGPRSLWSTGGSMGHYLEETAIEWT